ncbi:MAG: hypothetical protein JKY74_06240 [Shewanella sp.]|nr:hypothetical protein [Shewanella sp.]
MRTVFMQPEFQIIKEQISSKEEIDIVMAQGAIECLLEGSSGVLPDSVMQALRDLHAYFNGPRSNRSSITQEKMDDCLYTIMGCIKRQ